MKKILANLGVAIMGGVVAVSLYKMIEQPAGNVGIVSTATAVPSVVGRAPIVPMLDFAVTARNVTAAVVHIKTLSDAKSKSGKPNIFGGEPFNDRTERGSGSGVIISNKGHIITNRHVIADANSIEVILSDRSSYRAKVIGIDASTDLALLKIEANKVLPSLDYGDSDVAEVGDWVLAVGNPFNLASTVTAGIISAKARNINISENNLAVESFLQTDAAVNPGNSGGALVDVNGKLIGINTAIATPTGYFAGYSFAVPVTLVRKVVEDFLLFGEVRRAFLGVAIADVDGFAAARLKMSCVKGVCINNVNTGGAAQKAGIQPDDVVVKLENKEINNTSELQEMVSRYRPGDKVKVGILRQGLPKEITVQLQSGRVK